MKSYFKLALKVLIRRKFFTFISLFGISLTLVVLVVASSLIDHLFTPGGPESRFDRVLAVYRVMQRGRGYTMTTGPGYRFVRDHILTLPGIERASAFSDAEATAIYLGNGRLDTKVRRADANYWQILDFRFLEGRPYTRQEEESGALVAVITEKLRRSLFAGGQAVGQTVEIDGRRFRVVGVVPSVPITRLAAYSEIWVPLTSAPSSEWRNQFMGEFNAIVLARDRADIPGLKSAFNSRIRNITPDDPKQFQEVKAWLDTPFEAVARTFGPGAAGFGDRWPAIVRLIFAIAAMLFMTLPALNLVTLNLSRILERSSEIGVRKAFGAPRASLVGQFVLENVVLTLLGGLIAIGLSALALLWINGAAVIPDAELSINARVLGYGLLMALFFGVLSGFYPAWRMSRFHPVTALRGGAQ
ncbi:MAG TPA: ABC transporter permease [Thermoanaerobaculia bacterium]|nr:ABC transporter permease [Thermoanaerobaculia bacterium]